MKKITAFTAVLLLLASAIYAAGYRKPDSPIYAVSLQKNNHTLYIPRTWFTCGVDNCVARIQGKTLQIQVTFQPADSPFGQCRASYGAATLPCRVKQRYYYRFGDTMRPYLVLSDETGTVPLTTWQFGRWQLETALASLALGDSVSWIFVAGLTSLGIGAAVFSSLRKTALNQEKFWAKLPGKPGASVLLSLPAAIFLAGAIWAFLLFLLFAFGVMLD